MSQLDTRIYSERCIQRERGRQGDMVTDTGTREPSAAGTQLSPKECGERWGHYWKMATGAEH